MIRLWRGKKKKGANQSKGRRKKEKKTEEEDEGEPCCSGKRSKLSLAFFTASPLLVKVNSSL
jgi:hypothetical protein